jgi:alpha-N-acetylglucosamine transferase
MTAAVTNPRTIALWITAFLASVLIFSTLRSSYRHASWLPSLPKSHALSNAKANANKDLQPAPKVAFATFLAAPTGDSDDQEDDDKDGYFVGTRVLAYQLLHSRSAGTNSSLPFLVLCTPEVSERKRKQLKKDGATVVVVEKLGTEWVHPATARWRDVMTKLRLFEMTEYTKICFIDADHLVTGSLDGVFYDEATLTQPTLPNPAHIKDDEASLPRTYMFATHGDFYGYEHPYPPDPDLTYLNCGFFVFAPSKVLFEYYMSLLQLPGRFDPGFPEQNLLNYAHRREGNMPWKPLWYGWNVNWPTERDWRGECCRTYNIFSFTCNLVVVLLMIVFLVQVVQNLSMRSIGMVIRAMIRCSRLCGRSRGQRWKGFIEGGSWVDTKR